jgi:hypothetical protein
MQVLRTCWSRSWQSAQYQVILMKILAIEHETDQVTCGDSELILKQEALKIWQLFQSGFVREFYFRKDRNSAVLMLECADLLEAQGLLDDLPLVRAGLITFELIPLVAYPGLARLFEREHYERTD